jgi:hypothetical protein
MLTDPPFSSADTLPIWLQFTLGGCERRRLEEFRDLGGPPSDCLAARPALAARALGADPAVGKH